MRVTLGEGASAAFFVTNAGGDYTRVEIEVRLAKGAHFEFGGVTIGGAGVTREFVTQVVHAEPEATSNQTVRAVHWGGGTGNFLGEIKVARHAQKTDAAQDFRLLFLADDVEDRHAVLEADLVQHLAEVRGSRRMHERLMAFRLHRLNKRQRRQRVHIAGRTLLCRRAVRQRHALRNVQGPVLLVHVPAKAGDHLAEQCLSRRGVACGDHSAGALIANGQRLAKPGLHGAQTAFGYVSRNGRAVFRAPLHGGRHVRAAHQEPKVRRVDRRPLDAHEDLVRTGGLYGGLFEREFQFAFRCHQGTDLQACLGKLISHWVFLSKL
uniref:SufD family Fe-S cluster assembly protein n=1 Tax=Hyphomonas jannaschiana TaxID=86 RepID=UPI0035C763D6